MSKEKLTEEGREAKKLETSAQRQINGLTGELGA